MKKRYYPQDINITTSIDESGMLVDIERLPGESLVNFKKRILDSSVKPSNSSYQGLINGINRDLGLEVRDVVEIDFKKIIEGDLEDPNITRTEYVITDNRDYTGTIDGTDTYVKNNKIKFHNQEWKQDYLRGLTLYVDSTPYKIYSNSETEIFIENSFPSLYLNKTYQIKANWTENSHIGFALTLDNQKYLITSNTTNSLTLNKKIIQKKETNYSVVLNRPRVLITYSRIIFYKEYLNEENYQLDLIVDLRENAIDHSQLCKIVNEKSNYYKAKDLIPYDSKARAYTVTKKDSDIKIFSETIPASKFFMLSNKNIKPGTLNFSETDVFLIEEEEEISSEINQACFSVNYKESVVQSIFLPSGIGKVSYTYMDFPFLLESSPSVVFDLSSKESQYFLFSQKEKLLYEDSRDRFVSSQPKSEMIEYISELLSVSRQSWGE